MAGIIASARAKSSTNISDPLLKQTKVGIEKKVDKRIKDMFLRIEVAGIALLTQGTMPQNVLKKIQGNPDTASVVSDGVANIIASIFNEVAPKMPGKDFATRFASAAPVAAIAIMCQVLDMAKQALGTQITPDLVAKCTQATGEKVLAKFKITQQQIQQAVAAGKKGA